MMHNLSYQLAKQKDIDSIISVFSASFPNSIKWKMTFYSKEWLRHIIKSSSCEIWLGKEKYKVVGVLILVNDYKLFADLKKKISLRIYFFVNLLTYSLFYLYVKKIKEKLIDSNGKNICMQFIVNNDKENLKALSVEQLVVLPGSQRKGYGSLLVELAKKRAVKLSCDKLSLQVRSNNKIAYHLYIKNDFVEVH